MLSIAHVVEIGALICLPIIDQRLLDIVDSSCSVLWCRHWGWLDGGWCRWNEFHAGSRSYPGTEGQLSATYIRQRSFTRTRSTHHDTATLPSDLGSAFSFTPVTITSFGDNSEHLCCRAISQMVRADQIPLYTVSTHVGCRPGTNLISETGDLIKVVSRFRVRGEFAKPTGRESIGVTRAILEICIVERKRIVVWDDIELECISPHDV